MSPFCSSSGSTFAESCLRSLNPVATTVTLICSLIELLMLVPAIIRASLSALAVMIFNTSSNSLKHRSLPPVTLTRIARAPSILASSSRGLLIAFVAASTARLSPLPTPTPINASPLPLITVFTSAKSILISPGSVIRSEIP
ncbi:hypothetical protein ES708_28504 [subsurface metagenome]